MSKREERDISHNQINIQRILLYSLHLISLGFTTFQNVLYFYSNISEAAAFKLVKTKDRFVLISFRRWTDTLYAVHSISTLIWSSSHFDMRLKWLKSYLFGRLFSVIVLNLSWWSNNIWDFGHSLTQLEPTNAWASIHCRSSII